MRYFIVKYIKTPKGQMDEIVSISKKLKTNDLQTSAVVLDFRTRQVVLSSLNGVTVPKDWQRIRDFYHRHYPDVIGSLENMNTPDQTHPANATPAQMIASIEESVQ